MSEIEKLTSRIDAEIEVFQKGIEEFQVAAQSEYEGRETRFHELFVPASQRVADLLRPRFQVVVDRFKDRINIVPNMKEHLREIILKFDSPLAQIEMIFQLCHDTEVKQLLLNYKLEILPILMKFEDHSSLALDLEHIDEDMLISWFDDRVVNFVQTMCDLHRNQYYLKNHLVTDPISGVKMPKYAAKATLEADGKKYYFISAETKNEFEKSRAKS